MRNLQGSTDAELDQSMGRKAARLAAKPHVVGSIALDQRLRGGGGGGGDPLRFDSGTITKGTFGTTFSFDAQFEGGMPPYSAVCVPEAVGFGGINGTGRSTGSGMDPAIGYVMTVTDSLGASVDLLLNVFGFANNETRPLPLPATVVGPEPAPAPAPDPAPETFPWDTMTTHAQIDAWADANSVTRGPDWAQMTLASKRAWLVAYYDGDRPWETAN